MAQQGPGPTDPQRGILGPADPQRGILGPADPQRGILGPADPQRGILGPADPQRGILGPADARQCPWCRRWALKDDACNWVCCGLESETGRFVVGAGCGRQWCFLCGRRLCGALYDCRSGQQNPGVATSHTQQCCFREACTIADVASAEAFYGAAYCQGGHNSHR